MGAGWEGGPHFMEWAEQVDLLYVVDRLFVDGFTPLT